MIHLRLFENFGRLTLEYLSENYPIEFDEYFFSGFNIERFFVMIDDKPSYYTSETGFNQTKDALYNLLEQDGMISNDRVDVPIIKQYLRSAIDKKFLIWIHGLPGSGKSYLALEKQQKLSNKNFIVLDDIYNFSQIEEHLINNEDIILTSPYYENYSFTKYFEKLNNLMKSKYTNYFVINLWFENDKESCKANLRNRTEHKIKSDSIISEIDYFSKNYSIPSNVRKIPVYRPR